MQVNEVIQRLIEHSGMSANAMSAALGRSREWARLTAKAASPRLDTAASVADVAGVDIVLVDRATGEPLGAVEPRKKEAAR